MKFSVLMAIHQRKDILSFFPKAIKSIYENTVLPDQVVVIIDGPVNKQFKKTINDLKNKFNYETHFIKEKFGLAKALNYGIKFCKNEYIFRADGDDFNNKRRFEKQLFFFSKGYDLIGSNIDEFDEYNNFLFQRKVPLNSYQIKKILPFRNPFNHMTIAFKKSVFLEVGGYPKLFMKEDYGLWIRIISGGKNFINLNESLVNATTGKAMIERRGGFKYILSEFYLQIFLLEHKLTNIFKAFLIFCFRSFIFMMPTFLRTLFYKYFLRNKKF